MISDASVKMITDTIQTIFMIGCPMGFFFLQ
jgi:hypothetical protein